MMNRSHIMILVLLTTSVVSLSDYKFQVFSVERCPMNKEEWDMASARLNCNKSFGYHCVPNKYLTSLVEFCYPHKRSLFKEGNCLELAADGILNHVPCNSTFSCGCPNLFYFGNEIYKHPMCLSINPKLRCFNADIGCILSRNACITTEQGNDDGRYDCTASTTVAIAMSICFIISISTLITCIILTVKGENPLKTMKKYRKIPQKDNVEKEEHSQQRCNESPKNKQLLTEDRQGMNPAHCAALEGHVDILKLMLQYECDMTEKTTRYKENIVHLAFISGSLDVCEFVASNENISGLLHAKNREGWNAIQCAGKNGHLDVLKFLYENGVDLKNKSNKTGKNCLHTVCENGCYKICEYVLQKQPDLITEVDNVEQHAGHYAAKIGHIDTLQLLVKTNRDILLKATSDNINMFHIACRHAWYDMCVFIHKEYPSLISEITEKGWNAGLFVTERGDAEEERLKILKFLVQHDLDLCYVSRSGKTVCLNA